jgi:hypothetical protein
MLYVGAEDGALDIARVGLIFWLPGTSVVVVVPILVVSLGLFEDRAVVGSADNAKLKDLV